VYLDSAYIAKFYLNEADSPQVRAAIARAESLVSSMWAMGEVACSFLRNRREGALNSSQCRALLTAFSDHAAAGVWTFVPVTERLLREMISLVSSLPPTVYLRTGDAVHLTTALSLGEREIWSSDGHVLAAAPHFGLTGRKA
jgi:predicted nucleic acid-binding protein